MRHISEENVLIKAGTNIFKTLQVFLLFVLHVVSNALFYVFTNRKVSVTSEENLKCHFEIWKF